MFNWSVGMLVPTSRGSIVTWTGCPILAPSWLLSAKSTSISRPSGRAARTASDSFDWLYSVTSVTVAVACWPLALRIDRASYSSMTLLMNAPANPSAATPRRTGTNHPRRRAPATAVSQC